MYQSRKWGSGTQELLDQVARHGVEEESEEEEQQSQQQQPEQQPAVGVPQEVAGRLEGVQEPDEAGIGPAGVAEGVEWAGREDRR